MGTEPVGFVNLLAPMKAGLSGHGDSKGSHAPAAMSTAVPTLRPLAQLSRGTRVSCAWDIGAASLCVVIHQGRM